MLYFYTSRSTQSLVTLSPRNDLQRGTYRWECSPASDSLRFLPSSLEFSLEITLSEGLAGLSFPSSLLKRHFGDCVGRDMENFFFFKILKSNNSQESAIKKISNFLSLFRKRLSFCRENQVENYEIEVQSPLGVKVKVRCTLTFKKHLCFQKAPMSPKRSWSAKNQLARQKSSWPGKKHRARQKSPGLAKTTRPAKNHLARQIPPGPPKITCPAKKHPALRTFLHIIPERYTFIDGDISAW